MRRGRDGKREQGRGRMESVDMINGKGSRRKSGMIFKKMRIKMRKKAAVFGVLTVVSLSFLGCSLAQEELENPVKDRLAGVYLTTEHLEMDEPQIRMNWKGEPYLENNQTQIEGTLGELSDERFLYFEGVEGYGIYSIRIQNEREEGYSNAFYCDEIFSDLHLASGNGEKIEATVYVGENGPQIVYFNPVYQREDGTVYLQQGTGLSWDGFTDGAAMTRSMKESVSEGVKGEEIVTAFECTIKIQQSVEPESTELLFLNKDNEVLDRIKESRIREVLENEKGEIKVPQGTEYLLLVQSGEDQGQGAEEKRSICNRGDEYLEFLLSGGEGFLEAVSLQILWQ